MFSLCSTLAIPPKTRSPTVELFCWAFVPHLDIRKSGLSFSSSESSWSFSSLTVMPRTFLTQVNKSKKRRQTKTRATNNEQKNQVDYSTQSQRANGDQLKSLNRRCCLRVRTHRLYLGLDVMRAVAFKLAAARLRSDEQWSVNAWNSKQRLTSAH